ncbi:hypothetical protein SPRG_18839 [Saprolegnia parasitica CBS 223.65]|uniref:LNR domain-containing protein n=1 Tax=Saprolegnia parasitica (strain CBS 223.65) TaxID=695850 RepID=A0A067CYD4_SAPPC|nr:hypothetical protein SPRG_18839 [Saprolegnia parasitica CBS 223.65]KDO35679.1 hypothetical protein SPRG_18839 [Saprolegnia parasitica CBS 223.65]|eukprot:XP_012194055.1 hypothetical protein SPRG_18839 [Saprolegnia parasitica CBS 223.65]
MALALAVAFLLLVPPIFAHDNIGNIDTSGVAYAAYGPIDAVYTWVNGSDATWQQSKSHWLQHWRGRNATKDLASAENRFRDNDELRYSIRSLETYAPWIRRIFLVTDGQVPRWLDLSHPRITVVPHADIFPNASHLPSFASPAIESHLDNIPGLAEYFLYFNDEVFLSAPVLPSDFMSPRGTQNLFFAWDAPECAPGCKHAMLGNGQCHASCNVASCDYDLGDCTCDRSVTPSAMVLSTWSDVCLGDAAYSPDSACAAGCIWNQLGDGVCNPKCNLVECAFDAGDCLPQRLAQLPHARVAREALPTHCVVLLDNATPALVLYQTGGMAPVTGTGIRRAVVVPRLDAVVVFFGDPLPSVLHLHIAADGASMELSTSSHGESMASGLWFTENNRSFGGLDLSHVNITRSHASAHVLVPWFISTAATVTISVTKAGDTSTITCTKASAPGRDCTISALGLSLRLDVGDIANARVCINAGFEGCIIFDADAQVWPLQTPAVTASNAPASARDCACGRGQRQRVVQKSDVIAHCAQLGKKLGTGPDSSQHSSQLVSMMCRMQFGAETPAPTSDNCASRPPLTERVDYADTFGDSLRHVNVLFNRAFGKPVRARGVPSHMPHFIQKRLLTELKRQWSAEFAATSSHRFREPDDMQFGFSYMHYVLNRRQLHPASTFREVFNSLIDINHNGVVDTIEMDGIARLLGDWQRPASEIEAVVDSCRGNSTALTAAGLERHCPLLALHLAHLSPGSVPPAHNIVANPPVVFVMIKDLRSITMLLQDKKLSTAKFICVNDDMSTPAPAVVHRLKAFFQDRWGVPSSFELAEDRGDVPVHRQQPTLGVNYLQASQASVVVTVPVSPPIEIVLHQDMAVGVGGVFWNCGRALVQLMCRHPEYVCNCRVLELGTGTGGVGLAAAHLRPATLLLTDLASIVPLTLRNTDAAVAASASVEKLWSKQALRVSEYQWGTKPPPDGPWDTVLCADCLYDEDVFDDFATTLHDIANPSTAVLLAYKQRLPDREMALLKRLAETFDIAVYTNDDNLPWNFGNDMVYVLVLRRRLKALE